MATLFLLLPLLSVGSCPLKKHQQMSSKMSAEGFSGRAHSIPLDILDDLASRFIVNAPQEERQDLIRMCFQVVTWVKIE